MQKTEGLGEEGDGMGVRELKGWFPRRCAVDSQLTHKPECVNSKVHSKSAPVSRKNSSKKKK